MISPRQRRDSIVVTCDFNDRCKIWGDNHESSERRNFVKDKGLTQIINQPTQLAHDGSPLNFLDLIITNSPNKFMECGIIPHVVKIYHCKIICKMSLSTRRNHVLKRIRDADKIISLICPFQYQKLQKFKIT